MHAERKTLNFLSNGRVVAQGSWAAARVEKRRSNRQIKRKKYAEDAEGKQSEEEVKGSMKIKKNSAPLPGEQPLQLFVENPSEEDAAIVDKILSSRTVKKEVINCTLHFTLYSPWPDY